MSLYLEFVTKINVLLTEFVLSYSKVNLEDKHIALVIDSMNGGGAENVCLTLVRELLAKQYRVDLVLLEYRGKLLSQIPTRCQFICSSPKIQKKSKYVNFETMLNSIRKHTMD